MKHYCHACLKPLRGFHKGLQLCDSTCRTTWHKMTDKQRYENAAKAEKLQHGDAA